jgi:hypothetical protein
VPPRMIFFDMRRLPEVRIRADDTRGAERRGGP